MKRYFLHIGLHKTGTKFFQYKLFPNLPKNDFIYNPPRLTQLICDLIKSDDEDLIFVKNEIKKEKDDLASNTNKKIIISREIMSGDCFRFYPDYKIIHKRLSIAFPNAHIICFLRYQLDWLVSCYRETVHMHHYQTIEEYLSLKEGNERFVKANYKALDLPAVVESLNNNFGINNISYFFFEDFKSNKVKTIKELSTLLGTTSIPVKKDRDNIPNRGYSAFSIKLSLLRFNILRVLGLSKYFIHRPIFMMGKKGVPAGFEHLSVLPKEKYWHDGFLRDNEELRSANFPNNLTFIEKVRLELSWRSFIKKRIDKLFYWDWDMLGDLRIELDSYFRNENKKLNEILNKKDIPFNYTQR